MWLVPAFSRPTGSSKPETETKQYFAFCLMNFHVQKMKSVGYNMIKLLSQHSLHSACQHLHLCGKAVCAFVSHDVVPWFDTRENQLPSSYLLMWCFQNVSHLLSQTVTDDVL